MARRTVGFLAMLAALIVTACGTGDTSQSSAGGGGGITIKDFDYKPQSLTVATNTKVTVTNGDGQQHTATAVDGSFDSGPIAAGASGSITFTKAGTFQYHCTIHSFMPARTVVVTG